MSRYELHLDEDIRLALRRLAAADQRSAAGTIRYLITSEAARRGLWTPSKPQLVPAKDRKATGS